MEGLIDVLCDRVGIHRATGDLLPNNQLKARTSGADWPQAPNLRGRLLDTALLLARDHTQQLRYHIEGHPDEPLRFGVPVNVYFPYSRNVDLLIKALCQYGQVRLNPSSPMPKLDDASNQLWEPQPDPGYGGRVSTKVIASTSSPPVSWKAEVPSEPQFLQRCTEITASVPQDPPHTISSTHRTKSKHMKEVTNFIESLTPTSRPTRRLTITLRDRHARSALQNLERSKILKHIQKSIQEQGIQIRVTKCEKHAGRRANFWVRADSRQGAGILRREWDVGLVGVFGRGAYMRESDGFVGMV
ncbi:MAG: hypothetical protein Q9176_004538 [Flavoplaca citrina]